MPSLQARSIVLVVAKSNDDADILAATKYALDNKLGDVLSQSYGEAEQCVAPDIAKKQHQIFDAMVAQGWTLFASSGDDGSDQPGCGENDPPFQAASSPASDPDVTSVGGTQLDATPVQLNADRTAIVDPGGKYIKETTWNEPGIGAGGGGFSVLFKRPDFQAPVVNGLEVACLARRCVQRGGRRRSHHLLERALRRAETRPSSSAARAQALRSGQV